MQSLVQMYSYIKANPVLTISLSLLGYLFVWLYKESRQSYLTNIQQELEETTNSLIYYGKLESALLVFLKYQNLETETKLYETIGTTIPYLSDQIRTIYIDSAREFDKFSLMLSLVQAEIKMLRENLVHNRLDNKIDTVERFYTRVIAPIQPIIFILFFGIVLFISIISWNQANSWFIKMNIICFSVSFFLGVMVIVMIFKEFVDETYKKRSKHFIICSILIALLPFVGGVFIEIAFLISISQFIIIYLLDKRRKKKVFIEAFR